MNLDIATLFLVLAFLCLMLGAALAVVWAVRGEPALGLWSISLFVRVPGIMLILARGSVADWMSIELANCFVLLGTGISWAGTRRLNRMPVSLPVVIAPVVIWVLACQSQSIYLTPSNRMVVVLSLLSVYSLLVSREFWRLSAQHREVRVSLAILFALNAAFNAGRALMCAALTMPDDILSAGNWFALTLLVTVVVLMLGGIVFGGLYNEQTMQLLRHRADIDSLTNVRNRRSFVDTGRREIAAANRTNTDVALLLFDLDHFKNVNDEHGHAAGDAVLKAFCAAVGQQLPRPDLFGRLGGEEFAALLPGYGTDEAVHLANRLRGAVAAVRVDHGETSIGITASLGVAAMQGEPASLEMLMSGADDALYCAKDAGRNTVVSFQGDNTDPCTAVTAENRARPARWQDMARSA